MDRKAGTGNNSETDQRFKIYGGQSSHLPLKINTAGVIPVIFASSILLLPNTMSGFGAGYRQHSKISSSKKNESVIFPERCSACLPLIKYSKQTNL